MENATKALLIAAAILIVIVLISLGVYVLTMGQNAMESVNMNEQEMYAFNSKFTGYEGTQRGSQINSLRQAVITSNQAAADEGATDTKGITLYYGNTVLVSADGTAITNTGINTGSYYSVTLEYQNGLVHKITVSDS